ncbi:Nucleoporin Nup43 [Geranomyces michiganensis]|nr:Nucleoporin Nup43 [Geranomyces michiganensis]
MVATVASAFDYCEYRSTPHPVQIRLAPSPSNILAASLHSTPSTLSLHALTRPDALSFAETGKATFSSSIFASTPFYPRPTAVAWADATVLLAAAANGVSTYKIHLEGVETAEEDIDPNSVFELVGINAPLGKGVGLHAIDVRGLEFAAAGDDGRVAIARMNGQSVRIMGGLDTSRIAAIQWRGANELVTASSSGQLTLIDIRQTGPGLRLSDQANPPTPLNCLTIHPSQNDKLATGDANGVVGIWDLRNMSEAAVERLNVHSGDVWDVKFHPDSPGKVISCSEDGSICIARWSPEGVDLNPNWEPTSGLVRYQSRLHPLGFNSIDVHPEANVLVAAGDAGAIVIHELL